MVKPILSVIVTAYNIEKYIGKCLDSILIQKTDFKYEILIGEDCSKDSTRKIIEKYLSDYPGLIRAFFHQQNTGYSENLCFLIENARGEFLFQVDGDDYILSDKKLQLQVDLLKSHPECSMCFHNYISVDENDNLLNKNSFPFSGNQIFPRKFMWTNTLGPGNVIAIRKMALPHPLPGWVKQCSNNVDYVTHCLASASGDIYYLDETLTAYRKHSSSITTLARKIFMLEKNVMIIENLKAFFKSRGMKEDAAFYKSTLPGRYITLSYAYLAEGRMFAFIKYFLKGFFIKPEWRLHHHKNMMYNASPEFAQKVSNIFNLFKKNK